MSTKIHNGLILRNHTLGDALALLITIRDQCIQAGQKAVAEVAAAEMVLIEDLAENYCLIQTRGRVSAYWDIRTMLNEAMKNVLGEGIRDVTWDATLTVCLMPYGEHILATYYLENPLDYREALLSIGFEDYSYQNSTDRPVTIDAQAWEQRRVDWSDLLPRRTAPRHVGVSFEMVTWDDLSMALTDVALVRASLPSEDERRKAASMRLTELGPGKNWGEMRTFQMVRMLEELEPARRESVLLCQTPLGIS